MAGVTCVGWTSEGKSEQWAHESEVPHAVWLQERRAFAELGIEDVFFVECTPRYPIMEKLVKPLAKTHRMVWVIDGPEYHGHPSKRRRIIGAGVVLSRKSWCGPESQDEIAEYYARRFHRGTVLSADVYKLASKDEYMKQLVGLARVQRNMVNATAIESLPNRETLELILPPGAWERYNEWSSVVQNSDVESLWVDLEHHPGSRGASQGQDVPVLMRNATIMQVSSTPEHWYMLTGLEHLTAMGFHVHPAHVEAHGASSRGASILAELPDTMLKQFAGNGMHLKTQAAWFIYVMSNISPHIDGSSGSSTRGDHGSSPSKLRASESWDDIPEDF